MLEHDAEYFMLLLLLFNVFPKSTNRYMSTVIGDCQEDSPYY